MNFNNSLREYVDKKIYPLHMPGHKRNPEIKMCNPYEIDVTEVPGTDNLHNPEGIIKDFVDELKTLYETKMTFPLVGGSTAGNLAAIEALCRRGDTVIVDRGCHISVYNAMYLLDLNPVYIMRDVDEETGISLPINATDIEEAFVKAADKKVSAVILTSPTYEGIISDVKGISKVSHKHNVPVLVDAAHGAHFSFMKKDLYPKEADVVVESLHKTLPALNQTAFLHLNSDRVCVKSLQKGLDIFMTSSPSYPLLASIEKAVDYMTKSSFDAMYDFLAELDKQSANWKDVDIFSHEKKDPSRLVLVSSGEGECLADYLRANGIETEMSSGRYVVCILTVCDDFDILLDKLSCLEKFEASKRVDKKYKKQSYPTICKSIYEASHNSDDKRIAGEFVYQYPPGIPFLVPGELITDEIKLMIDA